MLGEPRSFAQPQTLQTYLDSTPIHIATWRLSNVFVGSS